MAGIGVCNMSVRRLIVVVSAVAAITLTGAAANAVRQRLAPNEAPPNVSDERGAPESDADELDPPTADERAELDRQAAIEAAIVASLTPGALYGQSTTGGETPTTGLALEGLLAGSSFSRLDSMLIMDVYSNNEGGLHYERVTYGDGFGYLMVFWQYLPGTADLGVLVGPGDVTFEGDLDVVTDSRDLVGSTLRIVRVFDGRKVLSIEANNLKVGIELEELKQLAVELFIGLPH